MTNIIYDVYNSVTEFNKLLKTFTKRATYIVNHLKNTLLLQLAQLNLLY
jgi:hypothetical protein